MSCKDIKDVWNLIDSITESAEGGKKIGKADFIIDTYIDYTDDEGDGTYEGKLHIKAISKPRSVPATFDHADESEDGEWELVGITIDGGDTDESDRPEIAGWVRKLESGKFSKLDKEIQDALSEFYEGGY